MKKQNRHPLINKYHPVHKRRPKNTYSHCLWGGIIKIIGNYQTSEPIKKLIIKYRCYNKT